VPVTGDERKQKLQRVEDDEGGEEQHGDDGDLRADLQPMSSHMRIGSGVAPRPAMNRPKTTSSKAMMKANSSPLASVGISSGRVTVPSTVAGRAPRLAAARSRLRSKRRRPAMKTMIT
jgi:hypothetical protein